MRYRELIEGRVTGSEVGQVIINECAPYLSAIDWDVATNQLYRGVWERMQPFFKEEVRLTDRKPANTDMDTHKRVNAYFTKKFGIPFRNGLFAIGNEDDSSLYGTPYMVFPVGEFKFCWSPVLDDFFTSSSVLARWYCRDHDPDFTGICGDEVVADTRTDEVMGYAKYQTTDLLGAIKSENEVMLWCDEAYMVNPYKVDLLPFFGIIRAQGKGR